MAKTGISTHFGKPAQGWRRQLYTAVFESDTRIGRLFDITLISAILVSVLVVVLDSIASISVRYGNILKIAEWFFTGLFTVEYIVRLICVNYPLRYARSFYGVIDLLAILPSYLAVLFPELRMLLDVRLLRLLRMFRILKLAAYVREYSLLGRALIASRRRIFIFLSVVFIIVFLLGTVMYVVEGPEHGFTSIPMSVYWAITTVATVGYGDIVPHTALGRAIASLIMLLGWGILAVPTGIITAEMTAQHYESKYDRRSCVECGARGHDSGAHYCHHCGTPLPGQNEI